MDSKPQIPSDWQDTTNVFYCGPEKNGQCGYPDWVVSIMAPELTGSRWPRPEYRRLDDNWVAYRGTNDEGTTAVVVEWAPV